MTSEELAAARKLVKSLKSLKVTANEKSVEIIDAIERLCDEVERLRGIALTLLQRYGDHDNE